VRNTIVTGAIAGALLVGGTGAALILPSIVTAADPSASPSTSSDPSTGGTSAATDSQAPAGNAGTGHGPGGLGGRVEAVSDASVVAKAIGISEADLNTALQGGQTIAAVAKAHNVDVQTVIDALVADAKDELVAAVKAGTMTQAQADTETSNLTQRITDQVNGTGFGPGGHGPGGMGRGDFDDDAAIVAKAIGISTSDLTTALQGGKSMAAVAKANNVDPQKVIDALVADKKDEIAAALKAGTITQAQADTETSNAVTFVTGQVNGTGFGPGHGPGGMGGDHGLQPAASPSTTG
jgi:predicted RNA-binding protein associated with RNAse of E/G family